MAGTVELTAASGEVVLVDRVDAEALGGRKVSIGSHGYPQVFAGDPPQVTTLHRWLTGLHGAGYDHVVDHINGDRLDNRRSNLRVVDATTSNLNRRVRGECVYPARSGRWQAKVSHYGRVHYLGTFPSHAEARRAVEDFRRQHGIVHHRFVDAA